MFNLSLGNQESLFLWFISNHSFKKEENPFDLNYL